MSRERLAKNSAKVGGKCCGDYLCDMVAKLLAFWRTLGLFFLILSVWLVWKGYGAWTLASTASSPVPYSQALAITGPVCLKDSLVFDLREGGLGQETLMGWKGEEYTVVPAHPIHDTTRTLLLVTSQPRYLGPVIEEYLLHMSSSINASNFNVKSDKPDDNAKDLQARAMVQVLGDRLKANLKDTAQHRDLITGVGQMEPASNFPQISGLEGNVLAIHLEGTPSSMKALAMLLGGLALFVLNILLWRIDRKYRARLAEEEELREPEAPLV